jgi:hypothetical protein
MGKYESEIEEIVANRFKEAFRQTNFEVSLQDWWDTPILKGRFDIIIYKGVHPLAVIEVKSTLQNKNFFAQATDTLRSAISITNSRFAIATDNESFYFYDRNEKDLDFFQISFDEIIKRLTNPEKVKIVKKDKENILNIFIEAANQYLQDNSEFLTFIQSRSFLSRIQFDHNSNTYFFSDNDGGITSFENQFFNKMFGEFKDTQICRYTRLKTIFDMLSNLTFRMSGLVGMNDKSEVNYVESYLNRDNGIISFEKPLIRVHHNTITAINNRYITSCSKMERIDDLTLWRLYSDDAKGVCLVFDFKKRNLNKHVLLQKVKYADENGKHKELDFLKQIKVEVERLTGFKFEFRKLGYWKHFFKATDYAIEEEVRLLIIDNDTLDKLKIDWVLTDTHSIINPIIDFRINSNSFPIQLRTILLGPKCPEQETNYVQIEEMIRRKKKEIKDKSYDSNLNNLKVELSSIKHYR